MNTRLEQMRTKMDAASIFDRDSQEFKYDYDRLQPYHETAALARLEQFDDIDEALNVLWTVDIGGSDHVWEADGEKTFYVPIYPGLWWLWESADDFGEMLAEEETAEEEKVLKERLANPTCSCDNPWCELGLF